MIGLCFDTSHAVAALAGVPCNRARFTVIEDVLRERARQEEKWGQQNHPDGTGALAFPLRHTDINLDLRSGEELSAIFRHKCGSNLPEQDNWRDILLEEVFEALAEDEPDRLRTELVQVAAVAASWVEAIDRRSA